MQHAALWPEVAGMGVILPLFSKEKSISGDMLAKVSIDGGLVQLYRCLC